MMSCVYVLVYIYYTGKFNVVVLHTRTVCAGNLTERKVGTFEAELIEPSEDEEKL